MKIEERMLEIHKEIKQVREVMDMNADNIKTLSLILEETVQEAERTRIDKLINKSKDLLREFDTIRRVLLEEDRMLSLEYDRNKHQF